MRSVPRKRELRVFRQEIPWPIDFNLNFAAKGLPYGALHTKLPLARGAPSPFNPRALRDGHRLILLVTN